MWIIFLLLALYSCTPKVKETVYKGYKKEVVILQQGDFYPELDEESVKYVFIISQALHIPVPDRNEVRKALVEHLRNKERLEEILGRMGLYEEIVVSILRKHGLPEELKFLPVIESAYNPSAVSRAGAAGLWQFMPRTAKLYGLKINPRVDERFDIIKSTEAAARHLRDLYERFGSWELALAAYHCGEGCVLRRVKRSFWEGKNRLPEETKRYVPSFFALLLLNRYPEKYGITVRRALKPVRYMYLDRDTPVREVLKALGLSLREFRRLNPHIKGEIIPAGSYVYFR
ncbi:lytic transglycosylase domain-containing protein [Aquifex sp.]